MGITIVYEAVADVAAGLRLCKVCNYGIGTAWYKSLCELQSQPKWVRSQGGALLVQELSAAQAPRPFK